MTQMTRCPECPTTGTPGGIRRHRSSRHGYPARGEYVDRYFDSHTRGTAAEILQWLEANYPDGNWPYSGWSQPTVSRDLAQHNNYPRRWIIVCGHHGPNAVWERLGPPGGVSPEEAPENYEDIASRIREVERLLIAAQSELRSLRTLTES